MFIVFVEFGQFGLAQFTFFRVSAEQIFAGEQGFAQRAK